MNRKKIKRRRRYRIYLLIPLTAIIIFISAALIQFDKTALPSAMMISEKYATAEINKQINAVTEKIISETSVSSGDFFSSTTNGKEQLNYLNIDSMLINKICSNIATELSKQLNSAGSQKIELPVGIFSGFALLADTGPKFSISLMPAGDAQVDYETKFESVGINQINFQIWLNITAEINIVNPLYEKPIIIKRKLMLVNIVFNGDVPSTYLNMERTK